MYHFHNINLQQKTAFSIATSFWQMKDVKEKTRSFFESYGTYETNYKTRDEWCKLTKVMLDEWSTYVHLPPALEIQLIHIIKMIGQTVYNWYQYLKHRYRIGNEAIKCIDQMYWTPFGTVDEVKIFELFWYQNLNLDVTQMYNFACEYALEKYINDLWRRISVDVQDISYMYYFYDQNIYEHFDKHILVYWECCRTDNLPKLSWKLTSFEAFLYSFREQNTETFDNSIYDVRHSTNANMLRLSIQQGHYAAVLYFWKKLTEEEKDRDVVEFIRIVIVNYNFYYDNNYNSTEGPDIGGYKRQKLVEICIFLMNQMTANHKKSLFIKRIYNREKRAVADVKDVILKMLLSSWPLQEVFLPILDDMLQYQGVTYHDDSRPMATTFLNEILDKMIEDHKVGYAIKRSKYRDLLHETWLRITKSMKCNIIRKKTNHFVQKLVTVGDIDNLKMIFNDPDINTVKETLNQKLHESFKSQEEKENFKKLMET